METLRGKYGSLLSQYKSRTTQEGILPENAPVWVCWWQGESSMPEIVQICYQSLRKHTSHPIHLITKDSIGQYLQLPDFIEEKVQKAESHSHIYQTSFAWPYWHNMEDYG